MSDVLVALAKAVLTVATVLGCAFVVTVAARVWQSRRGEETVRHTIDSEWRRLHRIMVEVELANAARSTYVGSVCYMSTERALVLEVRDECSGRMLSNIWAPGQWVGVRIVGISDDAGKTWRKVGTAAKVGQ